jgi:glycosyltransferase involved in cell wall biosynthesis
VKLGVLAVAKPRSGGTFQYTMSMLHALAFLRTEFDITLYCPWGNNYYAHLDFPIKRVPAMRIIDAVLACLTSLHTFELFGREHILLAPVCSPYLLHTRKPFAFTLHDLQDRYYPEYFTVMQRRWRKFLYSRVLARAEHVLCESNFVRNDITQFFGVKRERITVIPAPPIDYPDRSAITSSLQAIKEKYSLPSQYFFYPAQFWPHKNHLLLVEAFQRLASDFPECGLIFTGERWEKFSQVFRRVRELGLEYQVRHVGHVKHEEMPALYRLATALIVPSLFESVSIPIFEAFRYEIPVFASAVFALPEQVGDAGLLFDAHSPDSMAETMRRILTDSALQDSLRRKGKARIQQMTHERYARDIRSVLALLRAPSLAY